jgi:hypothetical protein
LHHFILLLGETQRDNLAVLVSGRNHGSDWFLNSVLHNVVDNRSRSRAIEKIGVGNELDNVCRSATGVLKENFSGARSLLELNIQDDQAGPVNPKSGFCDPSSGISRLSHVVRYPDELAREERQEKQSLQS